MATPAHVIYDTIYDKMKERIQQPSNVKALNSVFGEIINKNSEALASSVPDKAIFMDPRIEAKYYNIIGVTKNDISKAIKSSPDIYQAFEVIKNPMYVSLLMLAIIFHHLKNDKMRRTTMFICSLYMYRNIRGCKYFRYVNQNTINCMHYTVANLSYKSDLKKYKSINNIISKKNDFFIDCWFNENKSEVTGVVTDISIHRMLNDNYGRYNSFLKDFSNKFYKNLQEGKYMNVDKDSDEDGNYLESDNVSFLVQKHTEALMNKKSLTYGPDSRIINIVTNNISGCSINNLRNILIYVYDNDKEFEILTRLILQTYFFEYKKKADDVKSRDFLDTMGKYYKKQTSQDENLTQIKKIIEGYMEGSGTNKKINRDGTRNDCKRATFMYMLGFIMQNI